jgi:hypothetical protein
MFLVSNKYDDIHKVVGFFEDMRQVDAFFQMPAI